MREDGGVAVGGMCHGGNNKIQICGILYQDGRWRHHVTGITVHVTMKIEEQADNEPYKCGNRRHVTTDACGLPHVLPPTVCLSTDYSLMDTTSLYP